MKTIALQASSLLVQFLFPAWCTGQNLVSNASFESITACPEDPGGVDLATGWISFRGSPDLYNACNENDWYDVPYNAFGYQYASHGVGYVGVLTYSNAQVDLREYVGAALSEPLVPGLPVFVSMKIAVAGFGWYVLTPRISASGIGMFFTTQQWTTANDEVPNWAALSCSFVPTDTVSWLSISGQYVPDSAYTHVVIGNPFPDSSTETLVIDESSNFGSALAYIDEICVSTDPGCLVGNTIPVPSGDSRLGIYPNPCSDELFISLQGRTEEVTYRVFSCSGLLIETGRSVRGLIGISITTDHWPSGVFAVVLHSESGFTRTFAVVHL